MQASGLMSLGKGRESDAQEQGTQPAAHQGCPQKGDEAVERARLTLNGAWMKGHKDVISGRKTVKRDAPYWKKEKFTLP